MIKRLNV